MRHTTALGCLLLTALPLFGADLQSPAGSETGQNLGQRLSGLSFEEFRDAIEDDFNSFRTAIIENYAKFLDGEWVAFEPKMLLKSEPRPKPATAPVKTPEATPAPTPAAPERPRPLSPTPGPTVTVIPASAPDGRLRPKTGIDPLVDRPEVTSPVASAPDGRLRPKTGVDILPEFESGPKDMVKFFEMEIALPEIDFSIDPALKTTGDMARHWKRLAADPEAAKASRAIMEKAGEMGLNGYLTYELARAYAESKFPEANPASLTSLTHYLLVNGGYDVRLAQTGGGVPLLLLPFDSQVYAMNYVTLDGRDYTAFVPKGFDQSSINGAIYTANLPKSAREGKVTSLKLNGLNLPEKPRSFDIEAGPLRLTGTLNENLFPVIYRYPQMPTEGYASSELMPGLRRELVGQVKAQLGDMAEKDAVNGLLTFFHRGFEYATDQDYHGFEKPYFLEETLYYPKCDCEDRAIMLTWLLWEGLGLENTLLAYPGHESAAVRLKEGGDGVSYTTGGKTYYSCDPTYIGSVVGDCMPQFRHESPTVDKTYPDP